MRGEPIRWITIPIIKVNIEKPVINPSFFIFLFDEIIISPILLIMDRFFEIW